MSSTVEMNLSLSKQEFDVWLDDIEKAGKIPYDKIQVLRQMNQNRIQILSCTRCNHKWLPRSKKLPKVCPMCNSPYWNKPRRR